MIEINNMPETLDQNENSLTVPSSEADKSFSFLET